MKRTSIRFLRAAAVAGALSGSALALHATDTRAYSIARGQVFNQTSATAPTTVANYKFLTTFEGRSAAIQAAFLTTPSPSYPFLALDVFTDYAELGIESPSLSALNSDFPNGAYILDVESDNDGSSSATMNLGTTTFPTAIPHLANFAATQNVDPAAALSLSFDPFTGAGANDHVQLVISDGSSVVFATTNNPAVIPAGTLEAGITYEGMLRFVHDSSTDTTSIPGAVGHVSAFNETHFTVSTAGGSDGETPTLQFVNPSDGSSNVSAFSPVTFVFSTSMTNTYSIQWSPNVNTSRLNYTWQGDTALFVSGNGAFPAGETITWTLNPVAGAANNFRSVTGEELARISGSFTMAGGSGGGTNDCDTNSIPSGVGSGFIMKNLDYVQSSDAAPVIDPENPGLFLASYQGASNQTVTAVSLASPAGNITLSNFFGNFMAFDDAVSPAALETSYPAGNYTWTATGAGSGQIAVGSPAGIPVPHILNLTLLTNMDVTQPFVLRWEPFTGATTKDSISLEISASTGGSFHAPDPCLKIALTNTDTQITIPANTFKAGGKYSGSLTFSRLSAFNTNSIPNTALVSQTGVTTRFDFTKGGSGGSPVWLSNFVRNTDGTVTATIQADTGASLSIEGSNNLNGDWTQETVVNATTGSAQFTFNPKNGTKRFYRAKVL